MTNLSSLSKSKYLLVVTLGALGVGLVLPMVGVGGNFYAFLLAFLSLCGSFVYQQRTDRELERLAGVCRRLANGDFEARVVGIQEQGTLGDLEQAINEMTDALDAFVRESTAAMEYVSRNQYFRCILEEGMKGALLNGSRVINRATDSIADKMEGFTRIAEDLDSSLNTVVGQIVTSSTNLEKTAKTMRDTVSATRAGASDAVETSRDTSTNVQSISTAAEEMSSCIAEITQQMSRTSAMTRTAVEKSQAAQTEMDHLRENVGKIGAVVQMIENIAGQTNLLALNATIEAARAGEAGKGFAIVANEVKTLASQTTSATDEISALIASIEDATRKAMQSFDTIVHTISETEEAAGTVASAIEEQSAASREIASNAERTSMGTTSVANTIRDIDQSVILVDNAAGDVMNVTDEISHGVKKRVEDLQQKMRVFMAELKKIA